MNRKKSIAILAASVLAVLLTLVFSVGLLWSLIPMFGNTLPHHCAEWFGVSFGWSALLVSSVLGMVCVGGIAVGAVVHAFVSEEPMDG